MKSAQRRYRDDHDLKVLNAPLSLTLGQLTYLHSQPMTSSAPGRVATESYNNQMPVRQYRYGNRSI